MLRSLKLVFILGLFLSVAAFTPSDRDKSRKELAQFIDSELTSTKFSGSVYLACEGQVYLNKGYGKAGNKMRDKYYDIGSMSKQFTAAAIMKLVQEGKLKLTDPISKWIKNIKDPKKRAPTIEDLITHRSGMGYKKLTPEEEEELSKTDDYLIDKKNSYYVDLVKIRPTELNGKLNMDDCLKEIDNNFD